MPESSEQRRLGSGPRIAWTAIGALLLLPYFDVVPALGRIGAWGFVAIAATGVACFAAFCVTGRRLLGAAHVAMSLCWFFAFELIHFGVAGGPSNWVFQAYAPDHYRELGERFYQGNDAAKVLEDLSSDLNSRYWSIQVDAARTLGVLLKRGGTEDQTEDLRKVAVPELAKRLHDPNPFVRREAALSLRYAGPIGIDALPDLLRVVDGGDDVGTFAVTAIGNIGPAAASAGPVLAKIVADRSLVGSASSKRYSAAHALAHFPVFSEGLVALNIAARDSDPLTRGGAQDALKSLRSGAIKTTLDQ